MPKKNTNIKIIKSKKFIFLLLSKNVKKINSYEYKPKTTAAKQEIPMDDEGYEYGD